MKERLVLIGNGMAGIRTLEELFKLEEAERYELTVFGDEQDTDLCLHRAQP